ncbi:hypothetical protein [Microvirga roseola]|uniref:hypothetical protein n=1 Tax=Microvirga roseola TaxID=2883126 RepID=UPI001E378180|nr:hypothetical protein [Microvirga roseola]
MKDVAYVPQAVGLGNAPKDATALADDVIDITKLLTVGTITSTSLMSRSALQPVRYRSL